MGWASRKSSHRLCTDKHHTAAGSQGFIAVRVIFPTERHFAIGEVDDAVVGDRHAMCSSNPHFVLRLLSPIENAASAGEGFTGAATGPAGDTWACGFRAAGRRAPPPLRTTRRLNTHIEGPSRTGGKSRRLCAVHGGFHNQLREIYPESWCGHFATARNMQLSTFFERRWRLR